MGVLIKEYRNNMGVLIREYRINMGVLIREYRNNMGVLIREYRNSMGVLIREYRNNMGVLIKEYRNNMGVLIIAGTKKPPGWRFFMGVFVTASACAYFLSNKISITSASSPLPSRISSSLKPAISCGNTNHSSLSFTK